MKMHLNTLKERREGGNLITIYKLLNRLEETDRKMLILRRKEEARYLRDTRKNCKKRSLNTWNGLKEEVIMAQLIM